MNVALGGTLIQDVSTEHPGAADVGHRQHERGLEDSAVGHEMFAIESTHLPIFGNNDLGVNSFHHQAIRDLASDLMPVAQSPDGLVEAVVLRGNPEVFGVQWHPELMFERDDAHLRPFSRLVEAPRKANSSLEGIARHDEPNRAGICRPGFNNAVCRKFLRNCGHRLMLGGRWVQRTQPSRRSRAHGEKMPRHRGRKDVIKRLRENKRHFLPQLLR